MEDLELRESLQRYVRTDEPPFPFTASGLIAQGRGRQRRRIALGLAGGGAATTLAVISGLVLVPGSTGGGDLFADQQCRWAVPIGTYPWPKPQPTPSTDRPQMTPPPPGSSLSPPAGNPSATPPVIPDATPDPTPDATFQPTIEASIVASSIAGTATPLPPLPTAVTGRVDPQRLSTMSCFLKREMLELLPNRSHVPPSEQPLEAIEHAVADRAAGSWRTEYYARTMIVDRGLLCAFDARVQPVTNGPRWTDGVATTTPGGRRAYVMKETDALDLSWTVVYVRTADSHITLSVEGGLLNVEQLLALGDAAELDLYR